MSPLPFDSAKKQGARSHNASIRQVNQAPLLRELQRVGILQRHVPQHLQELGESPRADGGDEVVHLLPRRARLPAVPAEDGRGQRDARGQRAEDGLGRGVDGDLHVEYREEVYPRPAQDGHELGVEQHVRVRHVARPRGVAHEDVARQEGHLVRPVGAYDVAQRPDVRAPLSQGVELVGRLGGEEVGPVRGADLGDGVALVGLHLGEAVHDLHVLAAEARALLDVVLALEGGDDGGDRPRGSLEARERILFRFA
mmetsp:Transcript_15608/g.34083  ORF Transcript_15608/g.34083 Transcript_15608/m.34083 type:complete len:254 (+) Transcript_15608:279-1040(+)